MRKLLFVLMSALVLTSCGKDGNEPEPEVVYTVTFNADGGTPAPQSQTVKAGEKATAPTSPTKQNFVFLFWHLGGSTTAYNFASPVTSNITLQAKWENEAVAEYWQVSWELSGGTWPATGDNHSTQVVKGGTLAEPAAPTKAGKVFDGWYKEAALTNKINFPYSVSAVTANFTLYAKWNDPAAEYWNITWELNGGAWPSTGDNHVDKIEKGSTLAEPAAPTKTGSIFDGWYKEAAYTNKVTFPAAVTEDFTPFAKWSDPAAGYWNITWELNGGAWPTTGDNHVDKVENGAPLAEPATPTKEGSIFDGWYKEAAFINKISFPAAVAGDFKLYANWISTQDGVNINGVIWATRNVNMPGTFTDNPEDVGMFYQWNIKVGWSSKNPMIASNGSTKWIKAYNTAVQWEAANNPCPTGWRVPTSHEMRQLVYSQKSGSINDINGRFFGENNETVFFPNGGYRDFDNGSLYGYSGDYWGETGRYWTGTTNGGCGYVLLSPKNGEAALYSNENGLPGQFAYGCCIRCVKE